MHPQTDFKRQCSSFTALLYSLSDLAYRHNLCHIIYSYILSWKTKPDIAFILIFRLFCHNTFKITRMTGKPYWNSFHAYLILIQLNLKICRFIFRIKLILIKPSFILVSKLFVLLWQFISWFCKILQIETKLFGPKI